MAMLDLLLAANVVAWLAIALLTFVVLALARQIGVLNERIAPAGAPLPQRGLMVGETVPSIELVDLAGRSHHVGGQRERGQLVLFVSPSCPTCRLLAPIAAELAHARDVDLLYASDGGDLEAHRGYVAQQGIAAPYVMSPALARSYQVSTLPFALLVDEAGTLRARGLVNNREQLESLLGVNAGNGGRTTEVLAAGGRADDG